MRKLHLKSLDDLVGLMPILSEREQSVFIGGGTGSEFNPYTYDEYQSLLNDGVWNGGFVQINNSGINSSTEYISSSLDGTLMIGGNLSVSTQNSFMNCETPNTATYSLKGGTGVVDVSGQVNCDCSSGCIEDCICDSGCIECGDDCMVCSGTITQEVTGNVTFEDVSGTIICTGCWECGQSDGIACDEDCEICKDEREKWLDEQESNNNTSGDNGDDTPIYDGGVLPEIEITPDDDGISGDDWGNDGDDDGYNEGGDDGGYNEGGDGGYNEGGDDGGYTGGSSNSTGSGGGPCIGDSYNTDYTKQIDELKSQLPPQVLNILDSLGIKIVIDEDLKDPGQYYSKDNVIYLQGTTSFNALLAESIHAVQDYLGMNGTGHSNLEFQEFVLRELYYYQYEFNNGVWHGFVACESTEYNLFIMAFDSSGFLDINAFISGINSFFDDFQELYKNFPGYTQPGVENFDYRWMEMLNQLGIPYK